MTTLLLCLILFIASTTLSLIFIPIIRHSALKRKLVDQPNERKVHKATDIPRLGGIGIFVSFTIVFGGALLFIQGFWHFLEGKLFFQLFLPATIIFGLGLIDDLKGLRGWYKFGIQTIVAIIAMYGGLLIEEISFPLLGTIQLQIWAYPVTWLWIVGITNAINIIDGLDGLAGGIVFFILLTLFGVLLVLNQPQYMYLLFIISMLGGSILGFLRYNFNPAKIFMGDAGSYFLGIMVAIIGIMAVQKSATTVALLTPIIALGFPIMDTVVAFIRRILSGKAPFSADNEHIHHRLLDRGYSQRKTVIILYIVTLALGLLAFGAAIIRNESIAFIVIAFVVLVIFSVHRLGYLASKEDRSKTPLQVIDLGRVMIFGFYLLMLSVSVSISIAEFSKIIILLGFIGLLFFKLIEKPSVIKDTLFWFITGLFLLQVISSLIHAALNQNYASQFQNYALYGSQFGLFLITALGWKYLLRPRLFRLLILSLSVMGIYMVIRRLLDVNIVEAWFFQLINVQVPKLAPLPHEYEYSLFQYLSVAVMGIYLSYSVTYRWFGKLPRFQIKLPWLGMVLIIYLGLVIYLVPGVLVSLLVVNGLLLILIMEFPRKIRRFALLYNLIGIASAGILLILVLLFQNSLHPIGDYIQLRIAAFTKAFEVMQGNILLGIGTDQFAFVDHLGVEHHHAHNNYLQIFVRSGIPGLILLLIIYGIALYRLIHLTRTSIRLGTRLLFLGMTGALGMHFVYGLFDFTLFDSSGGNIFWMLLGLTCAGTSIQYALDHEHAEKETASP